MNGNKSKLSFDFKTQFIGVVFFIVVAFGLIADTTKADNNNFYSSIIRLDNVATKIHQNYVEEVSAEDLVDNAINGMLDILDPHSSFFKEKDYEELRIHTEGKFGGLGIQISIRDKVLTVMTPISGTPASRAGIQSGDQIITIDGKSTEGITIDAAVAKLRGEPGSDVKLTIVRRGEIKPMEFTITREIITIKSVPFSGVIGNNIGYISLLTFSQESGEEIQKSIKKLLEQNIKGLILDLRHNPGGLLPQAIEVSEKFLDKKSLVVSTRGRVRSQNKDSYASSNPVLPQEIPLVVLVDAASASASEIVAGAIQDWDRGVVMGDTTFGKGSVQSILPLDKEHHLKLTTAFYYTPSGRCINKPENAIKGKSKDGESDEDDPETQEKPDSMENKAGKGEKDTGSTVTDTLEYKTKSGRIVYGGGGIIPDTIVDYTKPEPLIRALFLKDAFFKFATAEYPKLQKKKVTINDNFTVDKKMMDSFYTFLDSIKFKYESFAEMKFKEFMETAGFVKDTTADSSRVKAEKPVWTDEESKKLKTIIEQAESVLAQEGKREFVQCEADIKKYIKEAFLIRGLGQDNTVVFREKLASDNQVVAAMNLLSDKKAYEALLKPSSK